MRYNNSVIKPIDLNFVKEGKLMINETIDIVGLMLYREKANLEKLNKRKEKSKDSELITLYFYERRSDGFIIKNTYKAVEKKNSYEVKDCWRSRLSKNQVINKYTNTLHHAMWTDAENDELMEELLERY